VIGDDHAFADAIALITTPQGPMVFLTQTRGDATTVGAWRLQGKSWEPQEKPPVTAGMSVLQLAAAATDAGPVVAWMARKPQEPPVLEVRRLGASKKWELLPKIADVTADMVFDLAATSDGTVVLARWSGGFKEILVLRPGGSEWSSIKPPGDNRGYLDHDAPMIVPARKDELILAWAGDRIEVAAHDGKQWADVVRALGRKAVAQTAMHLAAAGDGSFVLAWRDTDEPSRIVAAQFSPAPPAPPPPAPAAP
jgi:hypothetical protein